MATKKVSGKKGSTKKSASKKATKKSTKKATKATIVPPQLPNFQCLLTCYQRYVNCLKKGVPPATCQKRLQRCILRCVGGATDPGPDEE
jgi:hypothetical protein